MWKQITLGTLAMPVPGGMVINTYSEEEEGGSEAICFVPGNEDSLKAWIDEKAKIYEETHESDQ